MSQLLSTFSPKDRNLIKGSLRRAFTRSDLHIQAEQRNRIEHSDPNHPRCQKWSFCSSCGVVLPTWRTEVDHILPVQPFDKFLEEMTILELIERIFCPSENLQVLCRDTCHLAKTAAEKLMRKKKPKKVKVK